MRSSAQLGEINSLGHAWILRFYREFTQCLLRLPGPSDTSHLMKLNAALAKSLLMAASIGMIVPVMAQMPGKGKADKTKQPVAPPSADEPEPVIPGINIVRPKGGFLGLEIVGGNFKLSFYDEKKKPISADVDRANARWTPKYKPTPEHKVLIKSDDGKSLISPDIRPPYIFKLFLTLLSEDDKEVENHVVDVRP